MKASPLKHTVLATLIAFAAGCAPATASGDTWKIDPARSAVDFTVKHLMFSSVSGSFHNLSGEVVYDGKDLADAKVDATISAASIDTGQQFRDDHLRNASVLDAAHYPSITFRSRQVIPGPNGNFRIVGTLSMHGVERQVTLDAKPLVEQDGRLCTSATAQVNRRDFGITVDKAVDHGGTLVGENINVRLDIALVKQ